MSLNRGLGQESGREDEEGENHTYNAVCVSVWEGVKVWRLMQGRDSLDTSVDVSSNIRSLYNHFVVMEIKNTCNAVSIHLSNFYD